MIRQRLLIISVFALALLPLLVVACASSPPHPRLWFNEALQIDEIDFPPGVTFTVEKGDRSPCLEFVDSIIITNSSSNPLYLKAESNYFDYVENYQPCPEEGHCVRLVSNLAREWGISNHYEDPPWEYDWVPIDRWEGSDVIELSPYLRGLFISGSVYHLELFESRNVEGHGGDRPEDVSVPEDLSFALPYVYNGEELSVGVTITYSINECYPDKSFFDDNPRSPYTEIAICFTAIVIIVITVFMLIVTSVVKGIENRANKNQPE